MSTQEITLNRRYLFFTVFMGGMGTLAIEFVTSRMLQTVYGTSNIVWANVIGLVLFFLTMGYFLGGRLADRNPSPLVFYQLVCAAGASSVLFLLLTSVILRTAASALAELQVGAIVGSLIGVTLALAVPITLLGCISPFAIRLGVRDIGEAGRISGRIYAVSTWGSLLGTYLPVLYVIPEYGSRLTAVIFGLIIFLVGVGGVWQTRKQAPLGLLGVLLALLALSTWLTAGTLKQTPNQLFETESPYNYVQVVRNGDCNYLLLNEGQAYHSFYCDGGRVPRISVWSIMLSAPYFSQNAQPPQSMAVIGLAAGTIPKQFTAVYGQIPIDGIELDPAIAQAGRDYFDLTEPNINVIVGDGRFQLNQLNRQYDVITIDAYKVPYIPWHLTTQEFFTEVKARLTADGVVAMNVGRAPEDRRLVDAISATLLTVYPSVHAIDVPNTLNTILIATVQPTDEATLRANIAPLLEEESFMEAVAQTAVDNYTPITPSDVVFTDNRAPVETIVDSLVLRYLLNEGLQGLSGLGG